MRFTWVGPVDHVPRPSLPPPPGMVVAGYSNPSHNYGASSSSSAPPPSVRSSAAGYSQPIDLTSQRQQRQQYGDAYLGDTVGFGSEVSGGSSSLVTTTFIQDYSVTRARHVSDLAVPLSTRFCLG